MHWGMKENISVIVVASREASWHLFNDYNFNEKNDVKECHSCHSSQCRFQNLWPQFFGVSRNVFSLKLFVFAQQIKL